MGTKHTNTRKTAAELRDYGVRLKASAQAYENAAQTLEDSRFEAAEVRNIPQLEGVLTKVENSAGKVGLDVARSISKQEIEERAKARMPAAVAKLKDAEKRGSVKKEG
jgi:hypothetical protein